MPFSVIVECFLEDSPQIYDCSHPTNNSPGDYKVCKMASEEKLSREKAGHHANIHMALHMIERCKVEIKCFNTETGGEFIIFASTVHCNLNVISPRPACKIISCL